MPVLGALVSTVRIRPARATLCLTTPRTRGTSISTIVAMSTTTTRTTRTMCGVSASSHGRSHSERPYEGVF